MGKNFKQQVKVVTGQSAVRPSTIAMEMAFFDEAGEPITVGFTPAATVAAVAAPNATDLATAQALANELKTKFNQALTNLKAAGLMASA